MTGAWAGDLGRVEWWPVHIDGGPRGPDRECKDAAFEAEQAWD